MSNYFIIYKMLQSFYTEVEIMWYPGHSQENLLLIWLDARAKKLQKESEKSEKSKIYISSKSQMQVISKEGW